MGTLQEGRYNTWNLLAIMTMASVGVSLLIWSSYNVEVAVIVAWIFVYLSCRQLHCWSVAHVQAFGCAVLVCFIAAYHATRIASMDSPDEKDYRLSVLDTLLSSLVGSMLMVAFAALVALLIWLSKRKLRNFSGNNER
jgi:hypothetical protein